MLSTCSAQFVEVPPIKPKNSSLVVPAHADTSINRLAEIAFVGMYFASSVKRLFVPMPQTSTSSTGSPATVKSNAIAVAPAGKAIGNQAIGGELELPPPSRGCGPFRGPGGEGGTVWNVSRSTAESKRLTSACPP